MNELIQNILTLMRSCWRFRWLGLVSAWAVLLLGWVVVAFQKDVYEASARFYVDTTSDLRTLLEDQIVSAQVEDHLELVREVMLGKVQLRRVAEQTGLGNPSLSDSEWQLLLMGLRQDIFIQGGGVNHLGQRNNLFGIAFTHPDRDMAVQVVDALLNAFIDGLLGSKQSTSEQAGEFLREQLTEYEARLVEAEARLAKFNRENFEKLPSRQGNYFDELQAATEALDSVRQRLRVARSQLSQIESQMRGEAPRVTNMGNVDPDSLEGRILSYQTRLQDLQLRFTDNHPDVIASREILKQLREQLADQNKQLSGGSLGPRSSNNPVFQDLQISRNRVEAEISTLRAESADREAQVAKLQSYLDEMPQVEAERARLNRDYDVIRAHYQSLLESLEREQLSRDVFQSEQVDFRIVDPPAADSRPVSPKREILMFILFLASIGAGGSVAFLLSQFRPVVGMVSDLQTLARYPVIGQIGVRISPSEVSQRRRSWGLFVAGVLCLGFSFAGVFLFEVIGPGLRGI